MARRQLDLTAVLNGIERGNGRSTLFHWMVDNHDHLKRKWTASTIRWAQLAIYFRELGLTDRDGKPASVRGARQTWLRARRAVQAERAYQLTGTRTSLATASVGSGRLPTLIEAGSRATPSPTPNLAAGNRPAAGSPVSKEAVEAKLAAFQKTLDERSGR